MTEKEIKVLMLKSVGAKAKMIWFFLSMKDPKEYVLDIKGISETFFLHRSTTSQAINELVVNGLFKKGVGERRNWKLFDPQ